MAKERPGAAEIDASIEELAQAHHAERQKTAIRSPAPNSSTTDTLTAMASQVHAVAVATGEDYDRLKQEWERAIAEGRLVVEIATEMIRESAWRDRDPRGFADQAFQQLCGSIKAHGQITPVALRPVDPSSDSTAVHHEVIFGHRRVRACRTLGQPVRAVVIDADDRELVRRMLIENAQRQNLSALEKGRHYRRLLAAERFSRTELADLVGVSPQQISNLISVAELPDEVVEALGDPRLLSINTAQRLRKALSDAEGQPLEPLLEAVSEASGDANSKARLLIRLLEQREKSTTSLLVCDQQGQRFARVSRSGAQVVIRFDPALDEKKLRRLAELLPKLYATLQIDENDPPEQPGSDQD